ncbi:thymidylate synthase [Streptomyces sp. XM4193]|uniref:thymidylate synthase n=1 Tax=Streptomyces sp. XM4193 TaxID=2929782 RepID=UPI001FF953BA|nr:thymidylate synthase [Streptomyces sp. XM4193]MCK1798992.1 thymidylate synthase [Streptomyces sp. XM4193]
MNSFPGLQDAYLHHLDELLHRPQFRNAPRGHDSQEVLGVAFTLDDPLRRLVTHPARRTNLVFNFAEALWYLSGRDDLALLAHYAPSVARYSADGRRLTGTAYGPRIFRHGAGALDQWASVAETIRQDPDTKRAVIQIFEPRELLVPANPDVACTLALQFLLREGSLHAVAYMRANDAYRGMVSDVFSFTFLQEVMARQLRVPVGTYTHVAGSLHLYRPDVAGAVRLMEEDALGRPSTDRMPPLPEGDHRPHLARVLEVEEGLRTGALRLESDGIAALGLPAYWAHVVTLFELHRRALAAEPAAGLADSLPPLYRRLMHRRFPVLEAAPSSLEETDAAV